MYRFSIYFVLSTIESPALVIKYLYFMGRIEERQTLYLKKLTIQKSAKHLVV
ncbi:hypothetical protein JCM19047_2272 [Bacillus sp. JCM 19047]|nr:hypothetical protein JCM19047_2272 [Bacillus sp. JCM 19047]